MKTNSKKNIRLGAVRDKYNSNKVWVVKKYPCGHWYINQINSGVMLNSSYQQTNIKKLKELGIYKQALKSMDKSDKIRNKIRN